MPEITTTESLDEQAYGLTTLQNAATANGNGTAAIVGGYTGAIQVEIVESGGGTATVALQGALAQPGAASPNWYSVGYQQIDGLATLARSVSAISVAANSKHVYQVLDPYVLLQAVLSSVAGGAVVTVKVYAVPA